MIDITFIREHPERVVTSLKKRGIDTDIVAQAQHLDVDIRKLETQINELRAHRKKGSTQKPSEDEITQMQKLRKQIGELEEQKSTLDEQLFAVMAAIPNLLHDAVPQGKTDEDNVLIEKVGEPREFSFAPVSHESIPNVSRGIDIERGAKVSGTRFYYLKGKVALLERALMNYAIDFITQKSYELVLPPIMVKEPALYGTGYFPNGRNEVYAVNPGEDDLYLIGTSEQSLMAMHTDEVLDAKQLPMRYAGFSPCFRRESGTYGKDTKGIIRVHQFNKVEMVVLCAAADAEHIHQEMVAISKEFYASLGLPIQIMQLCSGDTGAQAARTIDVEAWFPSQQKYRELGSASTTTDYQSRRLKIRHKDGKANVFVHTLNNTVATDRAMLAVLENNQQEDGSVTIPEVLVPYCGFSTL